MQHVADSDDDGDAEEKIRDETPSLNKLMIPKR